MASISSDRFGNYRLVEQIGRGSAGTVYVGEYGALRRPIAVKVLHEHLVTDGSADRMLAEARALSMLDHPGIVKVLDCGMTPDGCAYIVMEYLAGELLLERLRRGPLSEERAVMFARQLASALEVAHAAGIIHRDVKPENAFVIPDPDVPGGERIKLLDFGIAKCGDEERTDTGVVLGTPAYMAPEQFTGSRRVDHRVDIYALGVVMYTMATGTLPFVGSDTDELQAEHSYCVPRPATETGVSGGLSEIIDRCLAKQPHDRFASMAQLAAALRELEVDGLTDRDREISADDGELDELDTAQIASYRVEAVSTIPIDLDIRAPVPWRKVLGAAVAIAIALVYARFEPSDEREQPSPSRVVERDPPPSVERVAVEAPAASPPRRERPAIEAKPAKPAKPARRDATRAPETAVRRESVRPPTRPARILRVDVASEAAEPETAAPRKKEDYETVSPPTLY